MRHAFALIYVMVIMMIIMITITSILTLGLSDIRQKNKVLATAGAWQMAQSGIEDAISRYQADPADPDLCSGFVFSFNVKNNTYQWNAVTHTPLATDQGDYGFSATCSPFVPVTTIGAAGYFKGSKVRMQADMGADNTKWNIYQVGF